MEATLELPRDAAETERLGEPTPSPRINDKRAAGDESDPARFPERFGQLRDVKLGSGFTRERILTPEQVADLLQVEPGWVRAAARDRRIPAHKLGKYWRFDRDEIEAWWSEIDRGCTVESRQ